MKYQSIIIVLFLGAGFVIAQEGEYKPAEASGEPAEFDGNTITHDEGKPSSMTLSLQKLEVALQKVPDDETGKKHADYERVLLITQKIKTWNTSARFADMCEVFQPIEGLFYSGSWKSLDADLRNELFQMLDQFHREPSVGISAHVKQNPGNPDPQLLEKFVGVYVTPSLRLGDSDWEFVDADTIDSAGVFVLDPVIIATILKSKSQSQIRTFLDGNTDNSFFERYEETGDGMNELKVKYKANKVAIHAKFSEVLAHVAELEKQNK